MIPKKPSSTILFSACSMVSLCCAFTLEQESEATKSIQYRGVQIVFAIQNDMFPKYWVKNHAASATSIARDEIDRSARVIKRALDRYPRPILIESLSQIFMVKTLSFSGITAGGTYYDDQLYLANKGAAQGYTDRYLTQSLHHEYSSVLLNKFASKFDRRKWKALNPKGFKYGESGTEAVRNGKDSLLFDRQLAEQGFICEYAQSNLEEDFNTIAARLFTADEPFWRRYESHEKLRKKIDFVIQFYESISPNFNLEYFRKADGN